MAASVGRPVDWCYSPTYSQGQWCLRNEVRPSLAWKYNGIYPITQVIMIIITFNLCHEHYSLEVWDFEENITFESDMFPLFDRFDKEDNSEGEEDGKHDNLSCACQILLDAL